MALIIGMIFGVAHPAPASFEECEAQSEPVSVDEVACRRIDASTTLGGVTTFSYYVPPACTASNRCPTLYLLHGFGGDYRSMLGTETAPSAWVRALRMGPDDPEESLTPWELEWHGKPPIDLVLVAPHGRTLAGGFGPLPGLDLFWADWNPRFANGASYDGPPPRFEAFLTSTLIPHVDATLPVGSGRDWRAIDGGSLGGYGAYKTGLQHPDLFASIGSVSGSHNILVAPGLDPVHAESPIEAASPVSLPYTPLPAFGSKVPIEMLPSQLQSFAAAFFVFGDPSFDQAWFRGNQPRDLTMNGRAFAGTIQSVRLNALNNDAIPRRPADFGPSYPVAETFEALVLAMNLETEIAFADQGVDTEYDINPGLHSGVYWDPFLRGRIEDHMRFLEPLGSPPPVPEEFDFRSISRDFSVWGWRFAVDREPVEFLNIRDASCSGVTLQGTGVVTVHPPPSCWPVPVVIDLGPAFPTDEQGGASALPLYGKTVRRSFHG